MSKLIKLARKFQLKLAQSSEGDFFKNLLNFDSFDSPETPEQKRLKEERQIERQRKRDEEDRLPATQESKNEINYNIERTISDPNTPAFEHDMMKAMKSWIEKTPNYTPFDLHNAMEQWQQQNKSKYDHRTEFQKSKNLDENSDPLPSNQEQEFAKQDKDIQQFMDKEQADKAIQQKSIQGKAPFNIQDAGAIINAHLNEIKPYVQKALKRKLIGDQKIMFIFYPNGNVGVVGQDIAMVNAIRRGFVTPLQLAARGYLTNYKKYFIDQVKYEISL